MLLITHSRTGHKESQRDRERDAGGGRERWRMDGDGDIEEEEEEEREEEKREGWECGKGWKIQPGRIDEGSKLEGEEEM